MTKYKAEDSVILQFGARRIKAYTPEEYAESLKRAFKTGGDDQFIVLDSNPRGQGFTAPGAVWGLLQGYLYISKIVQGDQEQVTQLKMTKKGRQWLTS